MSDVFWVGENEPLPPIEVVPMRPFWFQVFHDGVARTLCVNVVTGRGSQEDELRKVALFRLNEMCVERWGNGNIAEMVTFVKDKPDGEAKSSPTTDPGPQAAGAERAMPVRFEEEVQALPPEADARVEGSDSRISPADEEALDEYLRQESIRSV